MEETTNSMNMTRRAAVKGMTAAVISVAASACALGGAVSLSGCSGKGDGGNGGSAKYYRLPEFLSADGAAQIAELKEEGIAYFDQNNSWSWGGSPADNPLSGPVWLSVHSIDQNDEGFDTMSREDVEANKDISWADLNWVEVPYTVGEEESTLSELAGSAGLSDEAKSGWTLGNMSYVKIGSCRFEDVDAYWMLEMIPIATTDEEGETVTGDSCQIRLACFRLDGSTIDDIAESFLPDETPTVVDENGNPVEEGGRAGTEMEPEAGADAGNAAGNAVSADGAGAN